jgi:DNA-binding transcriptional LysR family regulator
MLLPVQSIDFNLLPIAQVLLTERSVTRAAARLHLSVPATSRALDRCRVTFGDPLLVRAGRRLVITPRGVELLPELDAAVAAIARAVGRPAAFDPGQLRTTFTIRTNEVILAVLAGAWLSVVGEQAPGVRLRFETEMTDDLDALRGGDVSLAIGSYAGLTDDLHRRTLVEERLVGIIRAGHPLAAMRITPRRFAGLRHVVTSRRGIARGPIDERLAERGLRREVTAVVPSFTAAVGMCLTSDLTTLAPQRLVDLLSGPATLISFPPPLPLPGVRVEVIWHDRHQHDPAHQWLLTTVEQAVTRGTATGP